MFDVVAWKQEFILSIGVEDVVFSKHGVETGQEFISIDFIFGVDELGEHLRTHVVPVFTPVV